MGSRMNSARSGRESTVPHRAPSSSTEKERPPRLAMKIPPVIE
jgi:hypothetical protein